MHCDKEIQWHTIIYSEYKYNQKQYNIEMFLWSDDFKDFINKLDKKYNIVIWWDGTMLYALNNYYKNNKDNYILTHVLIKCCAVNCTLSISTVLGTSNQSSSSSMFSSLYLDNAL